MVTKEPVAPPQAAPPPDVSLEEAASAEGLTERMLGRFLAGLAQNSSITHRMARAGEIVRGVFKSLTQLRGQLLAVIESRDQGQRERVVAPVDRETKMELETEAVLSPGRSPREFVVENHRAYEDRVRELERERSRTQARGRSRERERGDFER